VAGYDLQALQAGGDEQGQPRARWLTLLRAELASAQVIVLRVLDGWGSGRFS
jgi:cobaltochelatase CobN